jgi:hypothetical protein
MFWEQPTRTILGPKDARLAPKDTSYDASLLSADLLEKGVRRVGFIGLICGVMAPTAYWLETIYQPARVLLPGLVPLPQIVAATMFALGISIFAITWSRALPPSLALDLGLIFEVIGALGISLSENAGPWPADQPIRGISWNCIWIVTFVTAVPGTFGKIILAAFAAAAMGPIGLAMASAINHIPMPPFNQTLMLILPTFAVAGWAIPAARHIHRLRAQLSRQRELGSYRLMEPIGRGGMGEVWRAEHRMLARSAAIKLIRAEAAGGDPEVLLRRFDREAHAMAALRSPHTVTLYDYGISQEGQFYCVMELLEGMDLESLITRFGPLTPGRAVFLLRQACLSLAEAHELGLVHRDLKPRNIFVCRMGVESDFVKILDFGLAKYGAESHEELTQLTAEGAVTGTPAYISPEAAKGSELDCRADLYSLGCVAYWMLTGRPVFEQTTAMAMLLAHLQTPPTPLSDRRADIPDTLERVILSCLEKQPERRPGSARELSDRLERCDVHPEWTNVQAETWWSEHMKHAVIDSSALIRSTAETL